MPKAIEILTPPQVRVPTVSTVEAVANAVRDAGLPGDEENGDA